jgi:hypothetical protein
MTVLAETTGLEFSASEGPSGFLSAQRHRARHSLLDLDPDLGQLLDDERYAQARADLLVKPRSRPRGAWMVEAGRAETVEPHLGVLIIDGVLASEIMLQDVVSTELLGAGDIVRPWPLDGPDRLLCDQARWTVLADCRVAVLDQRFAAALTRYPELYSVLLERMDHRARRLATTQAIAQLNGVERRLLAMLWHLAERWGRVTPDGILIPLDVSHRLLGQLIGARRPTVSTAIGVLARQGAIRRRTDGAWTLHGDPPGAPCADAAAMSRRRLLIEQRAESDGRRNAVALEEMEARLQRLRREADTLQDELARVGSVPRPSVMPRTVDP